MLTQQQQQKQQRQSLITSSVAAAALGLDDKKTPIAAWESILGLGPDISNKATDRGNALEKPTLDYAAETLGLMMCKPEFRAHNNGIFGDSADALYCNANMDPVLIGEAKTVAGGAADDFGEEGTDQIPTRALVQCHWHLMHWPEVKRCVVPVLIGGWRFEFRLYYVDRNTELEQSLAEDLTKWHRDYVVTRTRPPLAPGDLGWVRSKYNRNTEEELPDSETITALVCQRMAAKAAENGAKKEREFAEAKIIELLEHRAKCKGAWGFISFRNNKDTPITDWEAIAKQLGANEELISKFTTIKPGPRVLRITAKGE